MRSVVIGILLLTFCRIAAQCPYTATLVAKNGTCIGDKLTVSSSHALSKIIWYKDGIAIDTINGTQKYGELALVAGGHGVGSGDNQLGEASGIFVDDAGNIYYADYDYNRVQKWAPGVKTGITVAGGNGQGSASNQTNKPFRVRGDESGNLYILEENNYDFRITKWAAGTNTGIVVAGGNGRGYDANQLFYTSDIYLDCDGSLYITDCCSPTRILHWPKGATSGVTLAGWYSGLVSDYMFNNPSAISLDGHHSIYVTDPGCECVARIDSGMKTGTMIIGGHERGADKHVFNDISGLYTDYNGNVIVADQLGIRKWTTPYTNGTTLIDANNTFIPISLFVDHKGNIYYSESQITNAPFPNSEGSVFKLPLYVSIDSNFKTTAPGNYYALVTDVNGYLSASNEIKINVPAAIPPSVKITATDSNVAICVPIYFTALPSNTGTAPSFQWQVSGVHVGSDTTAYTNNIFANGDQVYCIMSSNDGCNIIKDTSNIILLKIDPLGHATLTIAASENPVCEGTPIQFSSKLINGSNTPVYDWLLNGNDTGDSSAAYSNPNLVNGDVVYCLITSDASCGLAKSNSIPITVYAQPVIASGQVYNIPNGTSIMVDPVITGDIGSYLWTPATYLSDSTIRNPVVSPRSDMEYLLKVISVNGCADSAVIKINAYTPLRVPNAFTPNGDGKNDVFYVIGGPQGSSIIEFSIFNRWGQRVFQAKNIPTGSASSGWNGYLNGTPAPEGTYVYFVNMDDGTGHTHLYNGTLILIR